MPYGPLTQATNPAEDLLFLLLGGFAVFTLSYDIAVMVPISLRDVCLITAAACLLPLAALAGSTRRFLASFQAHCRLRAVEPGTWFLLACCLAAALVALLANRPDSDDSFYLARAVLDWEHWSEPIAPVYPSAFTGGAGTRFTSLPSWEHFAAAIAGVSFVHPLAIYHRLLPALAGFLVPFAWYCALTRISHTRRAALLGVAAILLLMVLDGTTHRGVAFFGLLRIWQGKVVLVALIAPLAIAATLDVMRHGRAVDWARLLLLGLVGMGLSTTAAFYLPILVGLAGGTFWLVYLPPTRIWQAPLAALAVFVYPALAVVPFYRGLAGGDALFPSVIASNLREILLIVFGSATAPTVIALAVALAGLALARRTRLLGWFTLWTAALAVPLAWPPAADLIVARLTSADAMWRLAYAGPVLLAIGAGTGALTTMQPLRLLAPLGIAAGFAAAVLLGLRGMPPSPFADPALRFPSLALKMSVEPLATARVLLERLPPGRILAPRALSTALPMLSARLLVTDPRPYEIRAAMPGALGDLGRAFDLLDGENSTGDSIAALERTATRGIDMVVVPATLPDRAMVAEALLSLGFLPVPDFAAATVFRHGR